MLSRAYKYISRFENHFYTALNIQNGLSLFSLSCLSVMHSNWRSTSPRIHWLAELPVQDARAWNYLESSKTMFSVSIETHFFSILIEYSPCDHQSQKLNFTCCKLKTNRFTTKRLKHKWRTNRQYDLDWTSYSFNNGSGPNKSSSIKEYWISVEMNNNSVFNSPKARYW